MAAFLIKALWFVLLAFLALSAHQFVFHAISKKPAPKKRMKP